MTKKRAVKATERGVMVCTKDRGVFFGYVSGNVVGRDPLILKRARMCVYWSADMKGVIGLAVSGPSSTCRVGQPAPQVELRGITAIFECDSVAVAKWESGPWT